MTIISVGARLTETITVKRVTSHSSGGDMIRGTTFTAAARIERGTTETGLQQGRDVQSSDAVFTTTELRLDDLVFFPEDNTLDDNTGRLVQSVTQRRAIDGTVTQYVSIL